MSAKKRVVVTGIGIISPLGLNAKESWTNAIEGKSGIGKISLFDTKDCACQIAGEVKNFEASKTLATPLYPRGKDHPPVTQAVLPKEAKRMGRFIHFALNVACEAYTDSGLDSVRNEGKLDPTEIGVNFGVGIGGMPEIEEVHTALMEKGFKRITPFFIPQVIANLAPGHISILLNAQASNFATVSACASSAHAIGESTRMIQRGEAKVMITGGAEATVCGLGIGGFASMKALSTRNDAPEKASRPYDKNRDGFVMGEGAACLILEDYEFAKARGAKIYAEITGYGSTSDAFHITQPLEDGSGGYRAMEIAVKDAGLKPSEINYVNAHGTSTPLGDAQEAKAIARLVGVRPDFFVSSTKSMTGHLLGAAGALEAAFTVMAIKDQIVPPTLNLDDMDDECRATGLNFTPHRAVKTRVKHALSNSFGFGGTNASLCISEYKA